MTKKMLRIGGTISPEEKAEWMRQMEADGFRNLWTWVCWVIRQRIALEAIRRRENTK